MKFSTKSDFIDLKSLRLCRLLSTIDIISFKRSRSLSRFRRLVVRSNITLCDANLEYFTTSSCSTIRESLMLSLAFCPIKSSEEVLEADNVASISTSLARPITYFFARTI